MEALGYLYTLPVRQQRRTDGEIMPTLAARARNSRPWRRRASHLVPLSACGCISIAVFVFFKIKAIFLKFWRSAIAICRRFHWMSWSEISCNSHQISSHKTTSREALPSWAVTITSYFTAILRFCGSMVLWKHSLWQTDSFSADLF